MKHNYTVLDGNMTYIVGRHNEVFIGLMRDQETLPVTDGAFPQGVQEAGDCGRAVAGVHVQAY